MAPISQEATILPAANLEFANLLETVARPIFHIFFTR